MLGDDGIEANFDAEFLELCQRLRAQIGRHGLKDAWSVFNQWVLA
jgi:hypothetical protein